MERFEKRYGLMGKSSIGLLPFQVERHYLELVDALRIGDLDSSSRAAGRLALAVTLLHFPLRQSFYYNGFQSRNPKGNRYPFIDLSQRFGSALVRSNQKNWAKKLSEQVKKTKKLNVISLTRDALDWSQSSYKRAAAWQNSDADYFATQSGKEATDWEAYIRFIDKRHGNECFAQIRQSVNKLSSLYHTALLSSSP